MASRKLLAKLLVFARAEGMHMYGIPVENRPQTSSGRLRRTRRRPRPNVFRALAWLLANVRSPAWSVPVRVAVAVGYLLVNPATGGSSR